MVARGEEALRATPDEIRRASGVNVTVVVANVVTPDVGARALAARPAPGILVSNAGGPPAGDFREFTREQCIDAIDANMLAPIELIKATVDIMVARKFGRIVNITSSAVKAPIDILALSNGARSGLTGFIADITRKYVAQNVTISNIPPGIFDTETLRKRSAAAAKIQGKTMDEIR